MVKIEPKEESGWEDRHDVIKTIKFHDKNLGWMHLVLGKRKNDGELVLRLKRFRNWFSIPSEKYLALVQKMLERGANELGWHSELTDEQIERMVEENKSLRELKGKTRKQIAHQKEVIDNLLEQVGKLREEQLSLNLTNFKNDIKEFKNLLKKESKERDIQSWLYDHPWVFGPTYIEGTKEVINRKGDRIDFLLQRYDTFYDVIELKLPVCKLFVGQQEDVPEQEVSRQYTMSADLKDAISQIIGYLEEYEIDKTNIKWKKGISIHKPRGIIVIGRSDETNKRALKSLNSYLHNIEIVTYEDMVDIGNNFIELIENRNKKLNNLKAKRLKANTVEA